MIVTVTTQAEFDTETKKGNRVRVTAGVFVARGNSSVEARGNSSVEAWGNSSVEAWENSSVVARGNSSVVARENSSVVARENSSVVARENSSVEAWENSSVVARGNVFVRLFSALKIKASANVVIMRHGKAESIRGGIKIQAFIPDTPAKWCEFYGIKVVRGIATLFKSVDDIFYSRHGANYAPGEKPEAEDWDGGERECGGGLHFSPHPRMAAVFQTPKHYVACPIKIDEMAVHADGNYPGKCKAKRVFKPCYEVDKHGKRIKGGAA